MAGITAQLIKELRDKTNAGMMDCKGALTEANGDLEEAETILRKKGILKAGKKASREVKEGLIDAHIDTEGRVGSLIEVNCETDFVAKNENFVGFVNELSAHIAKNGGDATSVEELEGQAYGDSSFGETLKAKIAEVGENLVVKRFARYAVEDGSQGVIAQYIHLAGKVGVLLEVGCDKAETNGSDRFREVVKDVTLHIAAASPICISRDEVDPALVAKEREVYAEQMKGKPENIIDKIVSGKIDKYFSTVALLEQGFIKDPDQSVADLLGKVGGELGDTLVVRRFTRFAVGEAS